MHQSENSNTIGNSSTSPVEGSQSDQTESGSSVDGSSSSQSGTTDDPNGEGSTIPEERKFTITLDLAGGTIKGNVTQVVVTYDKNYDLGTPEKEDYTFLGWFKNNEIINTSGVWQYEEDMTLTAKWESAWSPIV